LPREERQYIMGNYANLAPGSTVPASGNYRCCFCGEGGIADFMAKALGDLPVGGTQLRSQANQRTVRYFQQGKRLPKCPNCAGGTGWTLLEHDAPNAPGARRHDAVVEESGVCDVCSGRVANPGGYLLTTRQVVGTPAYWRKYYEAHKDELRSMGVQSFDGFLRSALVMVSCAEAVASQATNWMICDRCISLFNVDSGLARDYARRWWESRKTFNPPGTGAVSLSAVDMGFGPLQAESRRPAAVATAGSKKWWKFWR
jgi:hypothetical protein